MSSILVLVCVCWCALAAAWPAGTPPAPYALEDAERHFENFIQKFDRNYADESEKQARFHIFKKTLEEINSLNENSTHAVFGITQFSDMSPEEIASKINCLRTRASLPTEKNDFCKYLHDEDINYNDAPESFDWRDHGVVTPIKDQGVCGSCYAFSAIGNIEGQHAIKHKELVRLSEQQIVDCDERNGACCGGRMDFAMRYLIEQGGSENEADYPYVGGMQKCVFDANKVKVKLEDCRSYNLTSQEKLKQQLYHHGPIAVAISAHPLAKYTRGILTDDKCDKSFGIDHGVLLVGYGSENGTPFWIVKNSWGTVFGEEGYFRMQRGEGAYSLQVMNDFMTTAIIA